MYKLAVQDLGARLATRLLIRLAFALWVLCAFATVWEAAAMQAPDSPFHAGILAGPVGQLRGGSFALGAGVLGAAWVWPWLYPEKNGRIALGALILGVLISTASLVYAAQQGMVGVQVVDPRPDARVLVIVRALGHALLTLALLDGFIRSLLRK